MDPYRTMTVEEVPQAPRDQGIVGDVIAQFADPNAFYRELVQNAIDAGSPSVDIRIDHDPGEHEVHVTVRDRGEGMSQDTIENQLLVLFRSTKETDHAKIGKFGIGFASVLAPNPDAVIVQSARDGRRLTLHLFRDLTYELFDAGPATQAGTSVELVIAIDDAAVEPFVKASVSALLRWCRHATVPIELTYTTPSEPAQTVRIDRPLTIEDAIVQVCARSEDGQLYAAVGLAPDLAPYTGFFNHGLTLYETPEPLAGNVAAKLQDSRLGHTLSRDNVRRDEAFDRALAFARRLATDQLPKAVDAELRQAAESGDRVRYRVLANAVIGSRLPIEWTFPLVDPIRDARFIRAADLGRRMWISNGSSPLTAIVSQRGEPVIDLAVEEVAGLTAWIDAQFHCQLVHLEQELTLVTPIEPSDGDLALLAHLRDMLTAAWTAPSSLVLATLGGARGGRLAISGARNDDRHAPYVLDRADASRNPFGLLRKPPLVISAAHALVVAARKREPRIAASHLARAILLEYQLLDVASSLRLLDHTLDLLGVSR